jgi:uncharacterized protein YggL (DUF469 family)
LPQISHHDPVGSDIAGGKASKKKDQKDEFFDMSGSPHSENHGFKSASKLKTPSALQKSIERQSVEDKEFMKKQWGAPELREVPKTALQLAEEYLLNLRKANKEWPGGKHVPSEGEFIYEASETSEILYMLRPLEKAEKLCCYVKWNSSIASVIAKRFTKKKMWVDARYLEMISSSQQWVNTLEPREFRFDAVLSGDGIDDFFKRVRPEVRIWNHMEYMRNHYKKLEDLASTRKYGSFDEKSRAEIMTLLTDDDIKAHSIRHRMKEYHYIGPTPGEIKHFGGSKSPSYSGGYMSSGANSGDDYGNMYYDQLNRGSS